MTEPLDDYDEPEETPRKVQIERAHLRRLEDKAKNEGDRASKLDRELAFYRAGIDPADPKLSYFVKGYEGPTDAESIKAELSRTGFLATSPAEPETPPADVAQITQMANAVSGASSAPGPEPDFRKRIEGYQPKTMDDLVRALQAEGHPTTMDEFA